MHKADLVSPIVPLPKTFADHSFSRDNDLQHPRCLVSYHVEESRDVRSVVWKDIYGDVIKHISMDLIFMNSWILSDT